MTRQLKYMRGLGWCDKLHWDFLIVARGLNSSRPMRRILNSTLSKRLVLHPCPPTALIRRIKQRQAASSEKTQVRATQHAVWLLRVSLSLTMCHIPKPHIPTGQDISAHRTCVLPSTVFEEQQSNKLTSTIDFGAAQRGCSWLCRFTSEG
jgi:hypothetical protein